jgi:hypothetical protein
LLLFLLLLFDAELPPLSTPIVFDETVCVFEEEEEEEEDWEEEGGGAGFP